MTIQSLALLFGIFVYPASSWMSFGFVMKPSLSVGGLPWLRDDMNDHRRHSGLQVHRLHQSSEDCNTSVDVVVPTSTWMRKNLISARSARILFPVSSIIAGTTVGTPPAHAGIGTVIPFEETLKSSFPGALRNSVTLLRLTSTLRKRRYFQNMATVTIVNQNQSELSSMLAKQFSNSRVLTSLKDLTSTEKTKALVLFGPDLTIARDGTVVGGEQQKGTVATDIQSMQASLIKEVQLQMGGLEEVTLLGGLIIHRSKEGGKDAGEDCFQAFTTTTITSNGAVIDLYEPIFGDLPTPIRRN